MVALEWRRVFWRFFLYHVHWRRQVCPDHSLLPGGVVCTARTLPVPENTAHMRRYHLPSALLRMWVWLACVVPPCLCVARASNLDYLPFRERAHSSYRIPLLWVRMMLSTSYWDVYEDQLGTSLSFEWDSDSPLGTENACSFLCSFWLSGWCGLRVSLNVGGIWCLSHPAPITPSYCYH